MKRNNPLKSLKWLLGLWILSSASLGLQAQEQEDPTSHSPDPVAPVVKLDEEVWRTYLSSPNSAYEKLLDKIVLVMLCTIVASTSHAVFLGVGNLLWVLDIFCLILFSKLTIGYWRAWWVASYEEPIICVDEGIVVPAYLEEDWFFDEDLPYYLQKEPQEKLVIPYKSIQKVALEKDVLEKQPPRLRINFDKERSIFIYTAFMTREDLIHLLKLLASYGVEIGNLQEKICSSPFTYSSDEEEEA